MSWVHRMLAHFRALNVAPTKVQSKQPADPRHRAILRRADRIIDAYREADLVVVVRKR